MLNSTLSLLRLCRQPDMALREAVYVFSTTAAMGRQVFPSNLAITIYYHRSRLALGSSWKC